MGPQRRAVESPFVGNIRATANAPTVGETRERLQQFGGGAGGTIKKDKLFWFAAAERQLSKVPRQVFFGPIAGAASTPQTQEALSFYQSLQGPVESTNDATATTGRMDYQLANGSRITARFNFSDATAGHAITTGAPLPVIDNRAISGTRSEQDPPLTRTAQHTAILSPPIAQDLRCSSTHA